MIRFDEVSIRYSADGPDVLRRVSLELGEGQLILLAGRTGSGKSTLLGAINGHVPHFTGGVLTGRVEVAGLDTATHPPRDLAHLVGVVYQDPLAGFVTDTVEEELAYGMEQMGVPAAVMRTRVEETMDILGLSELRSRALRTLSGGQQQRVAIGSVLAGGVRVLVLDEPTSALDPVSSEEVLATLLRLVDDLGLTVVIAEHRLERVAGYAHRMILLDGRGGATEGETGAVMAASPLVPPVADLGRRAGWVPPPLTVREARRLAGPLRERLGGLEPGDYPRAPAGVHHPDVPPEEVAPAEVAVPAGRAVTRRRAAAWRRADPPGQASGLTARAVSVAYGRLVAVREVSLAIPAGAVTVIMGRNGSGKSSLMWALAGGLDPAGGTFMVDDRTVSDLGAAELRRLIRLVPQNATDLLYLASVGEECRAADQENGAPAGHCARLLDELAPGVDPGRHPRDLSAGQQLSLVLAIQLTGGPRVVLLDEPTRGLDYPAKASLVSILAGLAAGGRAVGVVTHDVEFAAEVADRIVVMATGEVIQDDRAGEVLGTSALFSPQVARVLYPDRWLTAFQVGAALAVTP